MWITFRPRSRLIDYWTLIIFRSKPESFSALSFSSTVCLFHTFISTSCVLCRQQRSKVISVICWSFVSDSQHLNRLDFYAKLQQLWKFYLCTKDINDTSTRTIYTDSRSALKTIVPPQTNGGPPPDWPAYLWIFLTGRPHSITLSTGVPQGCVLSQLLFTMLTDNCGDRLEENHIIKFTDNTTRAGLILNGNEELMYRKEFKHLEG